MLLVIGYGNTLRSDDGAGVRAAEMLEDEIGRKTALTPLPPLPTASLGEGESKANNAFDFPDTGHDISCPYSESSVGTRLASSVHHITILTTYQLTPELADAVAAADTVIFLDAAEGEPPGSVQITEVQPDEHTSIGVFAHHLTPSALLSAARDLYGHYPRRAYLITITAASFELGEGLSPQVESALPVMVERARQLIAY